MPFIEFLKINRIEMHKRFLAYGVVAVVLGLMGYSLLERGDGVAPPQRADVVSVKGSSSHMSDLSDSKPIKSAKRVASELEDSFDAHYIKAFQQDEAKLNNDPNDPLEVSDFAIQAEDSKYTEVDTVASLEMLLGTYRENVSGGYYESHINIEITNALLGDNPRKIAFLSASSSRINEAGRLVDSYGTPYDFHFISSKRMIIRSAGEDLKLYTGDDIISAREDELSDGVRMPGYENVSVDP